MTNTLKSHKEQGYRVEKTNYYLPFTLTTRGGKTKYAQNSEKNLTILIKQTTLTCICGVFIVFLFSNVKYLDCMQGAFICN